MRRSTIVLLTGILCLGINPAFARNYHYGYGQTGGTNGSSGTVTTTQPSMSVTTSTNPSTGITTTIANTTGGSTTATGGTGTRSGRDGQGRDALYDARAQSIREQTRERYDDRYFNADRVRDGEVRRMVGHDYTGPSATSRPAIRYGVVGNNSGAPTIQAVHGRTDAFEVPTDMDSP